MESKKFSGWKQLLMISIITGLTAQYGGAAVSLSNTVMQNGAQVAMTATAFGLGSTVYSLMQGPPQILIGAWINKQGARKVFMMGIPFLILVTLGLSNLLNSDISYILVFGVFWGLSYMLTSQIAAQTLINNWFIQRRGEAMNLMTAITCVFSFISPYVVQGVINSGFAGGSFKFGWYSIGVFGILSLPFVFFLKDRPEDIGQHPDGVEPGQIIETKASSRVSTIFKVGIDVEATTMKQALRKPVFWAIMICASLGFAVSMVGFAFSSVHFMEKGYELSVVTSSMSWSSIVRLVFILLIAKVSDRIEPGFLFGISLAAYGAALLLSANPSGSIVIIYAYRFLSSIYSACLIPVLATMLANIFGRESFPSLQGVVLTAAGLVSATTGTIGGLLADANNGSYSTAFIVYGIVCFIASVVAVFGVGVPCAKKYKAERMAHK